MKKKDFKIFYSWQSDLNLDCNKDFINTCLEKAVKELSSNDSLEVIPSLDKDTLGRTGSPNIVESVFSKIDICQILVADVSLINDKWVFEKIFQARLTPNPNVMLELGYGLYRLGWERIICINNSYYSNTKRLPFDLNHNEILEYEYGTGIDKEKAQEKLTGILKKAIEEIIENYEKIEEGRSFYSYAEHDRKIFYDLNKIITEGEFKHTLNYISSNQFVKSKHYELFNQICEFVDDDKNIFLISELSESLCEFKNALEVMISIFHKNFFSVPFNHSNSSLTDEREYRLNEYIDYKEKRKCIDENYAAIIDTLEKYENFRRAIKKKLMV